jgi:hypothetical protein
MSRVLYLPVHKRVPPRALVRMARIVRDCNHTVDQIAAALPSKPIPAPSSSVAVPPELQLRSSL